MYGQIQINFSYPLRLGHLELVHAINKTQKEKKIIMTKIFPLLRQLYQIFQFLTLFASYSNFPSFFSVAQIYNFSFHTAMLRTTNVQFRQPFFPLSDDSFSCFFSFPIPVNHLLAFSIFPNHFPFFALCYKTPASISRLNQIRLVYYFGSGCQHNQHHLPPFPFI